MFEGAVKGKKISILFISSTKISNVVCFMSDEIFMINSAVLQS